MAPGSEAASYAPFYLFTSGVRRYIYSFQLLLKFSITGYQSQVCSIAIRPLYNL